MGAELNSSVDPSRSVLRIEGAEAERFLQDLVTNDVSPAGPETGVYAALLTPQGKLIADMILWRPEPTRFLIDVDSAFAPDLQKRLTLYKLRAAVEIAPEPALRLRLFWPGEGGAPETPRIAGGPDPREPALGWRLVCHEDAAEAKAADAPIEDWERLRLSLGVPKSGEDLRANDAYPLEYGFERLHGVDFKKGCFVGQEIVARMKHKTELKKGLFRVTLDGPPPAPGTEVLADGKSAGTLGSSVGEIGLAHLRYDRAEATLAVGDARIVKAEKL